MQIHQFATAEDLTEKLASDIAAELNRTMGENFTPPSLVLPGGRSPRLLIKRLAKKSVDWNSVTITTTDERCVPQESDESNAGQIQRIFAKKNVDIEPVNMFTSRDDVETIEQPFDITVLGMGPDGHIASLFPGCVTDAPDALATMDAKATAEPFERISLTLPALLNSNMLVLLVIGDEKAQIIKNIQNGQDTNLPVARLIAEADSRLQIFMTI